MSISALAGGRHCGQAWLMLGLWFCALAPACQPTVAPTADTIIADEKMARILADLNIAEAATARLNGYPKDSLMHVYFRQVMEMHGLTVAAYETQLRVIASDQVRMDALLKNSEDLLEDSAEEERE